MVFPEPETGNNELPEVKLQEYVAPATVEPRVIAGMLSLEQIVVSVNILVNKGFG